MPGSRTQGFKKGVESRQSKYLTACWDTVGIMLRWLCLGLAQW